jgi:hypothetical protein
MAEKSFTIVYKKAPDYKIYPCQVVFGAPVPDNSGVLISFGVDHVPIPNYVQHPIKDGAIIDVETIEQVAQVGNIERELLCGVYMSRNQAKKLAAFLNKMISSTEGK